MLVRSVAALLAVALAAAPVAAQPAEPDPQGPPPVRKLVDEAMAAYEAGDLARALELLENAYALMPVPQVAFAMAKIHMERGECAKAIDFYRRFLESKPGPNSTQIATDAIADCQKILVASGDKLPAEPVAKPVEPEPAPLPGPAEPAGETTTRTRPWYTDIVGDALVAGGTGGLILGGVLALSARTDVDKANQGGAGGVTLEEYNQLSDDADQKQLFAAIAAGVGGALIIGGVVRYMTGDRTETITIAPVEGGASVGASWRF